MKHVIFYFYIKVVRFGKLMAANVNATAHWKLILYSTGTNISGEKMALSIFGAKKKFFYLENKRQQRFHLSH
jgi:hypothetical protein